MQETRRTIKKGNFSIYLMAHSITEAGFEALTWLWTYERMIHAEVMTHRWSRNYSSSRAIPYVTMMQWVEEDPAQSLHVGSNRAGMQAGAEIENLDLFRSEVNYKFKEMKAWCDGLIDRYNPHKEVVNRYTEPWGWIGGIATMGRAQYMNWLALRATEHANANIQRVAINSARLFAESEPQKLAPDYWHMPFLHDFAPFGPNPKDVQEELIWSVARAAWCSYNNPTKDENFKKAKERHDSCIKLAHATPCEHQLRARDDDGQRGLVPGYDSYRMMIPGESVPEVDIVRLLEKYGDRDYLVAK